MPPSWSSLYHIRNQNTWLPHPLSKRLSCFQLASVESHAFPCAVTWRQTLLLCGQTMFYSVSESCLYWTQGLRRAGQVLYPEPRPPSPVTPSHLHLAFFCTGKFSLFTLFSVFPLNWWGHVQFVLQTCLQEKASSKTLLLGHFMERVSGQFWTGLSASEDLLRGCGDCGEVGRGCHQGNGLLEQWSLISLAYQRYFVKNIF
jgi:hypothetical protein